MWKVFITTIQFELVTLCLFPNAIYSIQVLHEHALSANSKQMNISCFVSPIDSFT